MNYVPQYVSSENDRLLGVDKTTHENPRIDIAYSGDDPTVDPVSQGVFSYTGDVETIQPGIHTIENVTSQSTGIYKLGA